MRQKSDSLFSKSGQENMQKILAIFNKKARINIGLDFSKLTFPTVETVDSVLCIYDDVISVEVLGYKTRYKLKIVLTQNLSENTINLIYYISDYLENQMIATNAMEEIMEAIKGNRISDLITIAVKSYVHVISVYIEVDASGCFYEVRNNSDNGMLEWLKIDDKNMRFYSYIYGIEKQT